MNRHAYLLTVNSNYEVLSTCLRMLDKAENDIFILGDRKVYKNKDDCALHLPKLSNAGLTVLVPVRINWGGFSQIKAELILLKSALESGMEYSYLHFLQNSDLPVKSHNDILSFFELYKGYEFVNIVDKWSDRAWRARYRFFLCDIGCFKRSRILRGINIMLYRFQRLLGMRINEDITLYFGSALFSITSACARYILSREREILSRFRWAYCGDEIFLPTIIMDSPFKDKLLRYEGDGETSNALLVDWSKPHRSHSPRLWRKEDFEEIISKSDKCCYARKFIGDIDIDIIKMIEEKFS